MRKFFKKIFEIIFPCQCLSCSKIISEEALFCSNCWQKLQFITDPKCDICCHPFEQSTSSSLLICSKCLIKKPTYSKAISLLRYNHIVKKIVGDLKYRDNSHIAKKLAKFIYSRAKKDLGEIDIITAVPLHIKKLRQRKFNQSVLIAKELSKLSEKEFYYDLLIKVLNSKAQAELSRKERKKNLRNAFKFNEKYLAKIAGKNILLIDDVITTGTTLESCAKILKKSGAKNVIVLTLAKAVFV